MRRYNEDGRFRMIAQILCCHVYRVFKGEVYNIFMNYEPRGEWLKRKEKERKLKKNKFTFILNNNKVSNTKNNSRK